MWDKLISGEDKPGNQNRGKAHAYGAVDVGGRHEGPLVDLDGANGAIRADAGEDEGSRLDAGLQRRPIGAKLVVARRGGIVVGIC